MLPMVWSHYWSDYYCLLVFLESLETDASGGFGGEDGGVVEFFGLPWRSRVLTWRLRRGVEPGVVVGGNLGLPASGGPLAERRLVLRG